MQHYLYVASYITGTQYLHVRHPGKDISFRTCIANDLLNRKATSVLPDYNVAEELACKFSTFFKNKVSTICDDLSSFALRAPSPPSPTAPTLDSPLDQFRHVTSDEIETIIMRSPAKTCALDPIPTDLLKKCIPVVLPAITAIINSSFSSGIVPSCMKMADVHPVLKKPGLDRNCLQNYRPISNLSFTSKAMERAAFSQLTNHLENNHLLDSHQSAYRSNHSVERVLLGLSDHVLREMDQGRVTAVVLLDVSAAFDTVQHNILLERLESSGVTDRALQWFSSYLTDRQQRTSINGVSSPPTPLTHGVPQGSVGGPLLFSVYIKPLGDVIRSHGIDFHSYADDFQLFISFVPTVDNTVSALHRLELCVSAVKDWMSQNNLKLNDAKSEFILFGSKSSMKKTPKHPIRIGDSDIFPKEKCRNLGVTFDTEMTFNHHISTICSSVRFQLRNMSHIRKYLTRSTTECLVHSLISSRLDFSNGVLINLPEYQIQRLQRLQNSAARLITLTRRSSHITPILHSLHWLPVQQRIVFKILIMVFRCLHNIAPTYLQELVQRHTPTRRLRSSDADLLQVPRSYHSWGNRSFSVSGPSLWNALPSALRKEASYTTFKHELKTLLFS